MRIARSVYLVRGRQLVGGRPWGKRESRGVIVVVAIRTRPDSQSYLARICRKRQNPCCRVILIPRDGHRATRARQQYARSGAELRSYQDLHVNRIAFDRARIRRRKKNAAVITQNRKPEGRRGLDLRGGSVRDRAPRRREILRLRYRYLNNLVLGFRNLVGNSGNLHARRRVGWLNTLQRTVYIPYEPTTGVGLLVSNVENPCLVVPGRTASVYILDANVVFICLRHVYLHR